MKTLHPVDDATLAKIGKAYLICSEYPEVFGNVRMDRFCSMFVDVIPDDESERDARMKANAQEMYRILSEIREFCEDFDLDSDIEDDIRVVLNAIEGKKEDDE